MTQNQILDLYYLDARARLIDIAAFLDRVDRGEGEPDFRLAALRQAIPILAQSDGQRARKMLEALSDPSAEPVEKASGKGAVGAWTGSR